MSKVIAEADSKLQRAAAQSCSNHRVRFTDTAPPGSEVHFFASETRNPLPAWKYARSDTRLPEPNRPDADGRIVAYLDADKSYDVEIVHPDGRRRLLTDPAVDAVEVAKYNDGPLWDAVTELKQWLSELKTGETWRAAAISDLSTEVDALANSPTVQDYDDSALRTEIAALKQSVAELLAQVPYDDTALRQQIFQRLAEQDVVIEAQGVEITKLAKEVGGLKARIEALEGREVEPTELTPEIEETIAEVAVAGDSAATVNEKLLAIYRDAKSQAQHEQRASNPDMKLITQLEEKAERFLTAINWNRGRMVETLD